MQLIVVSGRSGSGKTIALRVLEDLGYYCVDNLPIAMLPTLVHAVMAQYDRIAISIDVRNLPEKSEELLESLDFLPTDVEPQILFIDADDQTLLQRFGETRRLHPLSQKELPLTDALQLEHKLLEPIMGRATWRIDSSHLSLHQLSEQVTERVLGRAEKKLIIVFQSFGFKYGLPKDADFVFDARILPNPHWQPELKLLSGLDEDVQHYFRQQPLVAKYVHQMDNFLATWLPHFQRSNRSYLTIATGCTGGQHRSVYITEQLAERFKQTDIKVQIRHREMSK
ncbi:RNase adapter RapZ [Idiomarina seosinensis]|uniref:RNase adapter RapZ n=1 Tax=Idiomarina seosinensis TaxID=281739 RepID=A0A432ZEZ0_9GAMM|nr:RNase adapter RapZ [Idiomarina seosinensis]RUO75922.1 RNase adapter RapZ [Idiomarina seosinensis]